MAYWDEQVELLAQAVDAIRWNSYYLLKVNRNDPTPPEPTKRPSSAPAELGTLADFNAAIGE